MGGITKTVRMYYCILAAFLYGGERMNNGNFEPFEQDIKAMNYMQLADWLVACRGMVKKDNYNTYEAYVMAVSWFCEEWEEFYRQHKECFHTSKFKKALLYADYKNRVNVQVEFGAGKESVPVNTYESIQSSFFSKPIIEEIDQSFDSLYSLVQEVVANEENFKEKLHFIISKQYFNDIFVHIRVFKDDGKQLKAASYKDAIALCEQEKQYNVVLKKKEKKVGFYAAFKDYDISTSVYTDYMSINTCEQEFNKKLFVNLAFILCLNATDAEKLLNYNGYSITNKLRQFDVICEKALRIGFGREYAIALIDKYNLEKSREFDVFKPIANLTKNSKSK